MSPSNPPRCLSCTVALFLAATLHASAENLVSLEGGNLQVSGGGAARLTKDADGDALTATIDKSASPFYLIQLNQPLRAPVAEGDRMRLSFRARSQTGNPMRAVIERSGPPYEAVAEAVVKIGAGWTDLVAEGEAHQPYAAGGLSARLQCGHQTGVIEIASLRLENRGPDPGATVARAAIEPPAVEERIRKIRMGDLRVEVRDTNGGAIPGATVDVEMTRSGFLFGCNFFGLRPGDDSDQQRAYRSRFTNLFNFATLPFYWGSFEREQGKPDHGKLEAMARWCREHNVVTKGHPLIWHEVWPRWAPREPDAAIPLLKARVDDLVPRYRGLIDCWDVLNEANNAHDFDNGEGRWIKRDGAPEVVATVLGWARAAAGMNHATFLYNDYNTGPQNEKLIAALKERNALPDAIGLQSHMHDHVWPLLRVWKTCEHFAAFGRPIHFTELTVLSGSTNRARGYNTRPGEWPTTPDGEAAQAAYVERLYSLLYSHPAVEAITWWDFSDLRAWRNAPAGLVREDMSPKPAYEKLHALIREKWWTRSDGKTDAAGRFTTNAFHGEHRIAVTTPDGRHAEITTKFTGGSNAPVVVTL